MDPLRTTNSCATFEYPILHTSTPFLESVTSLSAAQLAWLCASLQNGAFKNGTDSWHSMQGTHAGANVEDLPASNRSQGASAEQSGYIWQAVLVVRTAVTCPNFH